MNRHPHLIILNLLITVGSAFFYFSCSFLTARWLVLSSDWFDRLGPGLGQDLCLFFFAFVLATVPTASLLGLFPLRTALRLALPAGALAIFFMMLQGYFFFLVFSMPFLASVLIVLVIFIGMVALASQLRCSYPGRI